MPSQRKLTTESQDAKKNCACVSEKRAIMAGAGALRRATCVGISMVLANLSLIIALNSPSLFSNSEIIRIFGIDNSLK